MQPPATPSGTRMLARPDARDDVDQLVAGGDLIGGIVRDAAVTGRALQRRAASLEGPARVVVESGLAELLAGGEVAGPVPVLSMWADPAEDEIDAYLGCASVMLRHTRRLAASADVAASLAVRLRRRRAERPRDDLDGYALLFAELGSAEAVLGDRVTATRHHDAAVHCAPRRVEIRADLLALEAMTHLLSGRVTGAADAAASAERLLAASAPGWLSERVGYRLTTVRDTIAAAPRDHRAAL